MSKNSSNNKNSGKKFYKNNKGRKPQGGQSNNKNKEQNSKSDNIQVEGELNSENRSNNPNYYFKDAQQADFMTRIQMNAFGGLSKLGDSIQPTIMAFYANPCPGVTPYTATKKISDLVKAKGINRAAQKLWYILTAKSGRKAGYTKADCAILLLAIGAMIEIYEFIRRAFGVAVRYNQRNRTMPTIMWKAMCIDGEDFMRNAADYLKRMNSLMAIMNQLPIPGNIAWFAKCQEIYQKIFLDYPTDMAQMYVICPSTTWVIEENDAFIGGSYLRTVDMCVRHSLDSNAVVGFNTSSGAAIKSSGERMTINRMQENDYIRDLSYYIDVFEEQINNLLFSSTFSEIYADILRAFDNGALSRWTFDYIAEDYAAPIELNDVNRLWMFHNATKLAGLNCPSRKYFQDNWKQGVDEDALTYQYMMTYGTPLNDVYQWAYSDVIVYNPVIDTNCHWAGNATLIPRCDKVVVDFTGENPSVEERCENTRYMVTPFNKYGDFDFAGVDPTSGTNFQGVCAFDLALPDHWFELCEIYRGAEDLPLVFCDEMFQSYYNLNREYGVPSFHNRTVTAEPKHFTKFHNAPIKTLVEFNSDTRRTEVADVVGELNSWATLLPEWFTSVNDMIYVDLFDIR